MFYKDLLDIFDERPVDKSHEAIDILRKKYFLDAPEPVLSEIYYGLAGYETFQEAYGHIDLNAIKWKLVDLPIESFLEVRHATYYGMLNEEVEAYPLRGGIDFYGPEIASYWRTYGTWLEPPFFIERSILESNACGLQLIEGHTRLGALLGEFNHQSFTLAKTHKVFLAHRN
ncbi:TPA: hypothetical protein U2Q93_000517 [Enterobacter sichuanensis]|nr:hypothetical protein [Enterobacter sichuanensis]